MAARLIVLGRQGAGKGTQCARLASRLGVSHLSTGDLFRAEIAAGTPLGRQLDRYVSAGELVPDEVVLDVVATNLGSTQLRAKGYLLDGFPRTLAQGQALFEVLGAGAADLALEIDVPVEIVGHRLASRRSCATCRTIVAARDGQRRCDTCGGPLERELGGAHQRGEAGAAGSLLRADAGRRTPRRRRATRAHPIAAPTRAPAGGA